MSTNSVNRGYILQTAGENAGTWGLSPGLNAALQTIDANLGGVTTVSLSSSNVTLSSTQYANGTIILSGALSANVLVVFPAIQAWYTVFNQTTGSFTATLASQGATEAIAIEQGAIADILINGTQVKFRNLPPVGTYLDLIDSSVPAWITSCTIPPYLLCDGSTFSAVTYPYLNSKLGGTTLPDFRGRSRFYLDGGTGRITTAGSGIDGATRLSAGGAQNVVIAAANLPQLTVSITDPGHTHTNPDGQGGFVNNAGGGLNPPTGGPYGVNTNTKSSTTGITATANTSSANTATNKMPPACIGGLTLIRAA